MKQAELCSALRSFFKPSGPFTFGICLKPTWLLYSCRFIILGSLAGSCNFDVTETVCIVCHVGGERLCFLESPVHRKTFGGVHMLLVFHRAHDTVLGLCTRSDFDRAPMLLATALKSCSLSSAAKQKIARLVDAAFRQSADDLQDSGSDWDC